MSITFGKRNAKEIYFGNRKVAKVYFGNQLIWPKAVPQGNPLEGDYRLSYIFDNELDKFIWDVIGNDQEKYPAFYGKSLLEYVDRYTLAVRGQPNPKEHAYDWTDPPITENYRDGILTKVPGQGTAGEHSSPDTLLTQFSVTVYPKDGLSAKQFWADFELLQYFNPTTVNDNIEVSVYKPKETKVVNKFSVYRQQNWALGSVKIIETTKDEIDAFKNNTDTILYDKLKSAEELSFTSSLDSDRQYGRMNDNKSHLHTITLSTSITLDSSKYYIVFYGNNMGWSPITESRGAGSKCQSNDAAESTLYFNYYNATINTYNDNFHPYLKFE